MPEFRTIEIDFDVHRCIENERRGFDESPNDALRRLLKLPEKSPPSEPSEVAPARKSWSSNSVTLPHGTRVRMRYNGRTSEGQINDGSWEIEGRKFNSPSGAASGVAITKNGKAPQLNGWLYWEVITEKGWVLLNDLVPKPSSLNPSPDDLGI
jgi:hypothetical protein